MTGNFQLPRDVWHNGDGLLPEVGVLCVLDLGADEYRVAQLRELEPDDVNYNDEDETSPQLVWTDPDTGDEWLPDDVYHFCILPPLR